ncbi:MAG: hypothetical protein ACOCQR_00860 [bacterium]
MFYCDDCKKENNFLEGIIKSYGECEICGKIAVCSDAPTSYLLHARKGGKHEN